MVTLLHALSHQTHVISLGSVSSVVYSSTDKSGGYSLICYHCPHQRFHQTPRGYRSLCIEARGDIQTRLNGYCSSILLIELLSEKNIQKYQRLIQSRKSSLEIRILEKKKENLLDSFVNGIGTRFEVRLKFELSGDHTTVFYKIYVRKSTYCSEMSIA